MGCGILRLLEFPYTIVVRELNTENLSAQDRKKITKC